jgi:hypothetical protein
VVNCPAGFESKYVNSLSKKDAEAEDGMGLFSVPAGSVTVEPAPAPSPALSAADVQAIAAKAAADAVAAAAAPKTVPQ